MLSLVLFYWLGVGFFGLVALVLWMEHEEDDKPPIGPIVLITLLWPVVALLCLAAKVILWLWEPI